MLAVIVELVSPKGSKPKWRAKNEGFVRRPVATPLSVPLFGWKVVTTLATLSDVTPTRHFAVIRQLSSNKLLDSELELTTMR